MASGGFGRANLLDSRAAVLHLEAHAASRMVAGCSAGGSKSGPRAAHVLKRASQGVQRARPGLAKPSASRPGCFSEVGPRLPSRLSEPGAALELPRCSSCSRTRWETRDGGAAGPRDPAATTDEWQPAWLGNADICGLPLVRVNRVRVLELGSVRWRHAAGRVGCGRLPAPSVVFPSLSVQCKGALAPR